MRSGEIALTASDISWLAGLLEAEGSFMKGTPSQPRTPRVMINMTDLDVIQRVATLWCSSIKHFRKNVVGLKEQFSVQIGGGSAVSIMQLLRPFMGIRRQQQIDRAIASYRPQIPYGHRVFLLPDPPHQDARSWLAGYLEGEGYFTTRTFVIKHKRYQYPYIELSSTDRDIVERVQVLWDLRYAAQVNLNQRQPKYTGSKLVFRVAAHGIAARLIMEDLYPLLGYRRQEQIREVFNAQDIVS